MASFFERRGYSAQTLEHDLEKMKHLYSHSTEEKMCRIPLILAYHPLNTRVQRILLDNFKVIADDPATSLIFPQPPMVAFRQDDFQLANITSSHDRKAGCNTRRDLSMSTPTLPNLWPYFQRIVLLGPKDRLKIKDSFTCLSSGLIYCIPCRRCPAIYIGETGPTHGGILVNISEASTRMRLDFPSQSISVLTEIPLPMHWSAGLNSAMGTNRGRGRKCISSFDSRHADRAASILILT